MSRWREVLEWIVVVLAALFGLLYLAGLVNGMVVEGQFGILIAGLSFLAGAVLLLPILWRSIANPRFQLIRYFAALVFMLVGVFFPGPTKAAVKLSDAACGSHHWPHGNGKVGREWLTS